MRKNETVVKQETKHARHGRIWIWLFVIILVVAGIATWFLKNKTDLGWRDVVNKITSLETTEQVVEVQNIAQTEPIIDTSVIQEQKIESFELQPACAVVENLLLKNVAPDNSDDYIWQADSVKIYSVLEKYGCPENATFFKDMAARKQVIANGLEAAYILNTGDKSSVEYLYSDEKICQTIENRVMQNINPNAYNYSEFLDNARTYAVLYEYGCEKDKPAYMRASLRELGVAVALMPTDKMTRNEIISVVEICKSLGVAEAAHLMVQRLKARGYDMEFLLEMEDIIHGIR